MGQGSKATGATSRPSAPRPHCNAEPACCSSGAWQRCPGGHWLIHMPMQVRAFARPEREHTRSRRPTKPPRPAPPRPPAARSSLPPPKSSAWRRAPQRSRPPRGAASQTWSGSAPTPAALRRACRKQGLGGGGVLRGGAALSAAGRAAWLTTVQPIPAPRAARQGAVRPQGGCRLPWHAEPAAPAQEAQPPLLPASDPGPVLR